MRRLDYFHSKYNCLVFDEQVLSILKALRLGMITLEKHIGMISLEFRVDGLLLIKCEIWVHSHPISHSSAHI